VGIGQLCIIAGTSTDNNAFYICIIPPEMYFILKTHFYMNQKSIYMSAIAQLVEAR